MLTTEQDSQTLTADLTRGMTRARPLDGDRRQMPLRLLVAAIATGMFFVLYRLSGWYRPAVQPDLGILRMLETHGTPALLSAVSVPSLMLSSAVVLLIGATRGRAMLGVRAFMILAACNVLGQVLKGFVLGRDAIATDQGNSFPSGHMIAFGSVALALWIVLPRVMRGVFTMVAALVLAVAAFELVHYGWHRPSDVVGSLLLVTAVGAVGSAASGSREHCRPSSLTARRRGTPADDPTADGR
ncbi:phosphatase PAP2 family protein [Brachybacterium sp. MASK1Z-5]|uniref:Phosphatase PAP2 family protein n=1 Tax=Brachybacterium halotolerans TaxID=2795215 RepID=A0ABS1B839_9MICO|nr:phosphatase PAP2 family protein [Brachybacterium halotolerans]MBK0330813.1 phosphatase PAP2 family protein [Brachybacterium halotolerans]